MTGREHMRTAHEYDDSNPVERDHQALPGVEMGGVLEGNDLDTLGPAADTMQQRVPDKTALPTEKRGCVKPRHRARRPEENVAVEDGSASRSSPTSTSPPELQLPGALIEDTSTVISVAGSDAASKGQDSSSSSSSSNNNSGDRGFSAGAQGAEAPPPLSKGVEQRMPRKACEGSSITGNETLVPAGDRGISSRNRIGGEEIDATSRSSFTSNHEEPVPLNDLDQSPSPSEGVKPQRAASSKGAPETEGVLKESSGAGSAAKAEVDADANGGTPADRGVSSTTTASTARRPTPSPSPRRPLAPLDTVLIDAAARVDAEEMAAEQVFMEALGARDHGEGTQGAAVGMAVVGAEQDEAELDAEAKATALHAAASAASGAVGGAAERDGVNIPAVSESAPTGDAGRAVISTLDDTGSAQGEWCSAPVGEDYVLFRQLQEPHMVFIQYQLAVLAGLIFMILVSWRRHGRMISALYASPAHPDRETRSQVPSKKPC